MDFNFKSILDLVKAFPDEKTCIDYLAEMRWNGQVVSPFDETSKVYITKRGYMCKNTGKYFNAKVGTIFEDTKIPLIKWYMALFLFSSHKKGISSHQLAKDISVTQKSAWFMLHRLRYAFDHPNFKAAFDGITEIDETFMGGAEKNKHVNKKTKSTQGRSTDTKTPVLGMRDRVSGQVKAFAVPNTKSDSLMPLIKKSIKEGSIVITDEFRTYDILGWKYRHGRVNHSAKEYVNGMFHTNGIENFWSHLKRGVDGIYHWVSVPHLQAYVNEYALRFNTRKMTTAGRFDLVLSNVAGRLTYKQLIK